MNFASIAPEIILTAGVLFLMAWEIATDGRNNLGYLAALVIVAAGVMVITQYDRVEVGFSGMVLADRFGHFFRLIIYLAGLLATLAAASAWHGEAQGIFGAEFFSLLLFSIIGMDLLVIGANLIVVFLGLEILSLPLY